MAGFLKIVDQHGRRIPMRAASYQGHFEGATFGRRFGNWGLSSAGPDASMFNSLGTLRARSRELVRNEPLITGGLDTLVAYIVGSGINPRWELEDAEIKRSLQQLWADWTMEADHDGVADFYGLQSLATRCMVESGEVLIRFIPQKPGTMPVPLKIQVLEPDHLDEAYNTQAPNGNEIRMGIEFSPEGRRVAYHMYREHPGESYLSSTPGEKIRVPASEVLHIYRPLRPGQKRGRPWLSSVIAIIRELNQYLDAEQVRKKAAAMFGGFITAPAGEVDNIPSVFGQDSTDTTDDMGAQIMALEPGTFPALPPGMDVKFSEPADVGNSYAPFVKHQERRIARGFGGLTYEKLSGDLSDSNYTSLRSGDKTFQRQCLQIINHVVVYQMCAPVLRYWLNTAVLSRAINLPGFRENRQKYYRVKWCHEGFPMTDPLKDGQAEDNAIKAGRKSRSESVAERGRDVEAVDSEIASDQDRADGLGLKFDTDVRNASK
ncbi:phage portal protein [Desulfosarcina ovata]|uniref:Phage portal protein n=1 Tax=Desulfosarcina ovata subsp. ovata TaxID=2752305 RepID=A0A5K8AHU6_9BACT|nr:phage portal protein [Desulfosarcina ovata]BBO92059.1 phage portal protein [Desulfosarcina ovata subsp. ovata]